MIRNKSALFPVRLVLRACLLDMHLPACSQNITKPHKYYTIIKPQNHRLAVVLIIFIVTIGKENVKKKNINEKKLQTKGEINPLFCG
jgi:hypothetical protein